MNILKKIARWKEKAGSEKHWVCPAEAFTEAVNQGVTDFSRAFIVGWKGNGNLRGLSFEKARIEEMVFSGTIGADVNFDKCAILNSSFCEAKTEPFLKISDAVFKNVSFSKAVLSTVSFKNCILEGCCFNKSILCEARFEYGHLIDCNFFKANLEKCAFECINLDSNFFEGATMYGAQFQKTFLDGANLDQVAGVAFINPGKSHTLYIVFDEFLSSKTALVGWNDTWQSFENAVVPSELKEPFEMLKQCLGKNQ